MDLMRVRLSPEFLPIVDSYRRILQTYWENMSKSGKKRPHLAEQAIEQLDRLDALRMTIRPGQQQQVAVGKL